MSPAPEAELRARGAESASPLAFFCQFGFARSGARARAAFAALMGFDRPWSSAAAEIAPGAELVERAMREALEELGAGFSASPAAEGSCRAQIDWGAAMVFVPLSAQGPGPVDAGLMLRLAPAFLARARALLAPRLGEPAFCAAQWRAEPLAEGAEAVGGRPGLLGAFGARSLQAAAPGDGQLLAWESALTELRARCESRALDRAAGPARAGSAEPSRL